MTTRRTPRAWSSDASGVPASAEYASVSRSVALWMWITPGGSRRPGAKSAPGVPATQWTGHTPPCARKEQ